MKIGSISVFSKFNRFIPAIYTDNFVIAFDWLNWQSERNCDVNDPALLNWADISTIQKLLITHVRQERFCSGRLAQMISNGHLLAILKQIY